MTRLRTSDFQTFHKENPEIWTLFKKFTFSVISRGFKHFGVSAVWERIRWHINVETKADPFKVNNNFRAFYARKFMATYPEYDGFFRRRESVADALYPPREV